MILFLLVLNTFVRFAHSSENRTVKSFLNRFLCEPDNVYDFKTQKSKVNTSGVKCRNFISNNNSTQQSTNIPQRPTNTTPSLANSSYNRPLSPLEAELERRYREISQAFINLRNEKIELDNDRNILEVECKRLNKLDKTLKSFESDLLTREIALNKSIAESESQNKSALASIQAERTMISRKRDDLESK